jgi:predicted RNase H-like HicB family nuclease
LSKISYHISSGEANESGITIIFSDGSPIATINPSHPHYQDIAVGLLSDKFTEDELRELLRPALTAGKHLKSLSDRVTYDNGNIFYDGDPVDGSIADHIVRIITEGGQENQYASLVKFLEKLALNPSEESRKALYDYITYHKLTLLPSGKFVAYKGVHADGRSINSGYGIVDGFVYENDNLPNKIGSTVSIPRSKVDADNRVGCSTGLHAGTYAYASDFAQGLLLTVEIDPQDVVSVPDHCSFQKIRVSRYVVIGETVQEIKTAFTDAFVEKEEEITDHRPAVETYLARTGWDRGNPGEFGELWSKDETRIAVAYVLAPDSDEFNAVLTRVAAFEGRTEADVLKDIVRELSDQREARVEASRNARAQANKDFYNETFDLLEREVDFTYDFSYVDRKGKASDVKEFNVETVINQGYDVLITGKNIEGEYRSYLHSGMSNIQLHDDKDDAETLEEPGATENTGTLRESFILEVTREKNWWMIYLPDFEAYTQAESFDEVEEMGRDFIAGNLDLDEDSFINVVVKVLDAENDELDEPELSKAPEVTVDADDNKDSFFKKFSKTVHDSYKETLAEADKKDAPAKPEDVVKGLLEKAKRFW